MYVWVHGQCRTLQLRNHTAIWKNLSLWNSDYYSSKIQLFQLLIWEGFKIVFSIKSSKKVEKFWCVCWYFDFCLESLSVCVCVCIAPTKRRTSVSSNWYVQKTWRVPTHTLCPKILILSTNFSLYFSSECTCNRNNTGIMS